MTTRHNCGNFTSLQQCEYFFELMCKFVFKVKNNTVNFFNIIIFEICVVTGVIVMHRFNINIYIKIAKTLYMPHSDSKCNLGTVLKPVNHKDLDFKFKFEGGKNHFLSTQPKKKPKRH